MTDGVTLQAQSPAGAHADLGFLVGSMIDGQPMAMREAELRRTAEAILANRYVLPRNRKTAARHTENGTAIIEVHGAMYDRSPVLGSLYGLFSYESLEEQCRRIKSNPDIKRVVLDVDSPGGMVRGIEAASQALSELAKAKPVYAIANNMACSAGYWLACVAKEISVTPNGEVGSIGIMTYRVSYSEMLERNGISAKIFGSGVTKGDGFPMKPLSDERSAETQRDAERLAERFFGHVARHRHVSVDAVRDMQARCVVGDDAIEVGLADRVETLDELIKRVEKSASNKEKSSKRKSAGQANEMPARPASDHRPSAGKTKGAKSMSTMEAEGNLDLDAKITRAVKAYRDEEKSASEKEMDKSADVDAKVAEAVKAERERFCAILDCDEAKGKHALARKLAENSAIDLDTAKSLLAEAGAEKKDDGGSAGELNSALHTEMKKPSNSGGINPEATGDSRRPSLAERVKEKYAKK